MTRTIIAAALAGLFTLAACGGGGLSSKIEAVSEAVCACKDAACAKAKMEEMGALTVALAKEASTMTEADAKAIAEANAKAAVCSDKLAGAPGGGGPGE